VSGPRSQGPGLLRHGPPVRDWIGRFAIAGIFVFLVLVTVLGGLVPRASTSGYAVVRAPGAFSALSPAIGAASSSATSLQLGIAATPKAICAFGLSGCAAGVGVSRVTLTANAPASGVLAWPDVQVAFVLETTAYDGVFDPSQGEWDSCASSTTGLCEEANGVPFFVAHAQQIADAIQQANPHSHVTFALVDYFCTKDTWDDGDGAEYHVDISTFVPASNFGADVQTTFQSVVLGGGFIYGDADLSDNLLHSSEITALYGTIIGSGLNWAQNTHHVIVWAGASAPRDPNYVQNYCVSVSLLSTFGGGNCYSSGCEPSYVFANGVSPNCEGWIKSQDGNATHSIAQLAKTSPTCTDSIGGVCTIDAIDYWTTPTDPYSPGWPTGRTGGGPGGSIVLQNTQRVLEAGCDIAAATGGTWAGPTYFTCPNGQAGTLQYVPLGNPSSPNTNNPTLLEAYRQIGFGPIELSQVAKGTTHPLFAFVPFGNIQISADPQYQTSCLRQGLPLKTCQVAPSVFSYEGVGYLGWNWSTNASQNTMYVGDAWSASFNVIAAGGPYSVVPVDACTTIDCKVGGSGALNGLFTSATYYTYTNASIVTQSFPLGQVQVEFAPPIGPPPSVPPPAPPIPPPFPILAPIATPITQVVGVANQVGLGNVSLQATAAGFLAAGFLRVGLKNKPIALRVAAKAGPMASKFEKESAAQASAGIGRFE
jgi:hypothetical protein